MSDALPEKEVIVTKLRARRSELQLAGVARLAIFGSAARGESNVTSDLDFAATYDPDKVRTLVDAARIAVLIGDILGVEEIDLADEEALKPPVRRMFEREHVRIF